MTMRESTGHRIAAALADCGITTVFGVISIHNMPILDGIAGQGRIRFIPARGEAGAMNMADAFARVSGQLGVALTSTGTAAGNAAGAQAEALTAGSRVLHITTQVDREFMDRDRAAIHDVPRQPQMLAGISKRVMRIEDSARAIAVLAEAIRAALTPPCGPVSLEIPIDVQHEIAAQGGGGNKAEALAPPRITAPQPDGDAVERLAAMVAKAKRPMLWLGGGARGAGAPATALVERGFAAVTSTNGRAIVPESHPATLGAFNMAPQAAAVYAECDLMIVVGSRLRGNETRNNRMPLPRPLVQIDIDPQRIGLNYPVDFPVCGDAAAVLEALLARLPEDYATDAAFVHKIAIARAEAEGALRATLGPYQVMADHLLAAVHNGRHAWVRDITIANSTFGNRYVHIAAPHLGVHALGGGIGQGIAMAIGAAVAMDGGGDGDGDGDGDGRTIALIGDGGAQLGLAELMTAVEEKADITFLLMNDKAYGVIENIQDAQYGGRRHYSKLLTPDFGKLCAAIGMQYHVVKDIADFPATFDNSLGVKGPVMLEMDMESIGAFAAAFAGPPAGAAGGAR